MLTCFSKEKKSEEWTLKKKAAHWKRSRRKLRDNLQVGIQGETLELSWRWPHWSAITSRFPLLSVVRARAGHAKQMAIRFDQGCHGEVRKPAYIIISALFLGMCRLCRTGSTVERGTTPPGRPCRLCASTALAQGHLSSSPSSLHYLLAAAMSSSSK